MSPDECLLEKEIAQLQGLIHEVNDLARDQADSPKKADLLAKTSLASVHLGTLLKIRKDLQESIARVDYVRIALDHIRKEMEKKGVDSVLTSGLG
jgi:hypothetical protein